MSGKDYDRRLRRSRRHCQHWSRAIIDLRLADDIDGLAGEEEELAKLVERLDKASTAYGIDQYREGQADNKQHQWHQQRDQNTGTEACDYHKLQVPGLCYN